LDWLSLSGEIAPGKSHDQTPKNPIMRYLFSLSLILLFSHQSDFEARINLSGTWSYQLDREDIGESERWFAREFDRGLALPGSLASNGIGDDISLNTPWTGGIRNKNWPEQPAYAPFHDPDNVRFPFWLQPVRKYYGAAWFQKKLVIPENWKDKTIHLHLERCHWETTVWVNEQKVGMENSLGTPHRYDLSASLSPGPHTLTIRVDNRVKDIDPGENSHSISDHTQSNWNGIVGKMFLEAKEQIHFEEVAVFPEAAQKKIRVKTRIHSQASKTIQAALQMQAISTDQKHQAPVYEKKIRIKPGENVLDLIYELGSEALFWDEFQPHLYQLDLTLTGKKFRARKQALFGLRDFKVEGSQFAINGRPVFLRGTLECAIFPQTGFPATDVEEWSRIFRVIKSHGLNHMRFHSWCPPEAAFMAADEAGIYLQVECSSWANQSTTLGDGKPIDAFILAESEKIVREYGNHPSFVMMAYGNEPGGKNQEDYLHQFVSSWQQKDGRRVYTSGAGWPRLPVNDFHNLPQPRIQGWGEQLKSVINAEAPRTNYDWHSREKMPKDGKPVVSHEIGQWCVYPNFREMPKYTGVLKPKNLEIFQESLAAHHMGHLADSFLLASGKLQTLCYKADIEAALRTKDFAGFQLLDLHDFPGQGTALVGGLDPFWEEKGYVSPEEFSRFCNALVPLVRLDKRVFAEGETMLAQVEVANFGEKPIVSGQTNWKLLNTSGDRVAGGSLPEKDLPIANGIDLGEIEFTFPPKDKAHQLTLEVNVAGSSNAWDIWVYPVHGWTEKAGVRHITSLDPSSIEFLENGGTVLLSLGKGKVAKDMGGEVAVGFSSIFWNTAWTDGQKPHTLGILCDPEHPALADFPTEYHANWQWWDAMSHSDVIKLDSFPLELRPVVRVIDDWVTNRKLALIFEAKVGAGQLLVCGVDLKNGMEDRPEARQLRSSLLHYMSGEDFEPKVKLSVEQLEKIIR
jgi:hypothetical protein